MIVSCGDVVLKVSLSFIHGFLQSQLKVFDVCGFCDTLSLFEDLLLQLIKSFIHVFLLLGHFLAQLNT
jgi:hypothetical protein